MPASGNLSAIADSPGLQNLLVLASAQAVFVSGSILFITIGGIVGTLLAPDPSLATLPASLMVVGTAAMTIPAAMLMRRIGRRAGFAISAAGGAGAAWLGSVALQNNSFSGFCIAALAIGALMAFSQQFRFAAAESVNSAWVSRAISFVLLGSVVAALLGPTLVSASAAADPDSPFHNGMRWLIGFYVAAAVIFLYFRDRLQVTTTEEARPPRPLREIIAQPAYMVALVGGIVGQGVMTFVMTAAPISMHVADGFSIDETAAVIRVHVLAMFLPSLVSGWMVARFGIRRMMWTGAACLLATVCIGCMGHAYLHYWWSMVLLGLGWNLLYLGASTQLVTTYRANERFSAQAVNEFSVFGAAAIASLGAGSLLHAFGWTILLGVSLPALLLLAWVLLRPATPQTGH
ncbi:MAG: MFS transporter [Gammaproteobacteria bacterium]|nr:MFS transporter [Gammaproteobacteria bacterium]